MDGRDLGERERRTTRSRGRSFGQLYREARRLRAAGLTSRRRRRRRAA